MPLRRIFVLLNLHESQTFLIKIFLSFKDYLKRHSLKLEIINSYNRLYLSDLKANYSYIVVINFKGFDCLDPRVLRSGSFYSNVNEFGLKFTLCFLGFVRDVGEFRIYVNLHKVYEYFLDFLHENSFKFEFQKSLEGEYDLSLNYYLKSTGDLIDGGFVNVSCNERIAVLGLTQSYRADIQVIEIKD
ncbi:Putative cytosolic protein (plasmid) [Borrelia nietonii YOR]|uniref:Putative cytosolic protein n=2 Tax=Borrelia TaxID=138 RepID=W5SFW1_9SPIR|nr:Putative cytosolic protein [Borrelia nietonii YOR]AHH14583.1 Putative cytosolic protein [Borrelia hermsii MTW]